MKMSEESMTPNNEPQRKVRSRFTCVACQIVTFKKEEEKALAGKYSRRASFFVKQRESAELRLEKETNFTKLHLCENHYAEVKKLRKKIFQARRRTLAAEFRREIKSAQSELEHLELSHAEKLLRLGPDHDFVFRAKLKVEHMKRVLAQRIRRLKEIT